VTKRDRAVLVYFPEPVVAAVDESARRDDTDRSKWIRSAIRSALQQRGVAIP
jgi:metal-responsive CopG/Arc/MetJ family transcriptional regulator